MTIWFTSDSHFDHANFLTFKDDEGHQLRPFSSVEEMNELMIDKWNQMVQPQDHIYHLGDVTMARGSYGSSQSQHLIRLIKRLKGHKRLVLGNHDHFPMSTYTEAGFEKIRGCWKGFEGMVLTHIPVHPSSLNSRCTLNVHGHIHDRLVMWSDHHPDPRFMNICVEQTGYQPVPLEALHKRMRNCDLYK